MKNVLSIIKEEISKHNIIQYHMWYITAGVAALTLLAYIFNKKYLLWWIENIVFIGISVALGISLL